MSTDTKVIFSDQILTQEVGEEIVILDLSGEAYFGLDEVGARIWHWLEQGKTVDDTVQRLVQEYDVSEQTARQDLDRLIAELEKHRLASVEAVSR